MIDTGELADAVRTIRPDGPDYLLDLVGANTMLDSLRLVAPGGTVCVTGMLSGIWMVAEFEGNQAVGKVVVLTWRSAAARRAPGHRKGRVEPIQAWPVPRPPQHDPSTGSATNN